jgi:hypothetical protein
LKLYLKSSLATGLIVANLWACSAPPNRPAGGNAADEAYNSDGKATPGKAPNPLDTKKWVDQIMLDTLDCSQSVAKGQAELRLLTPDEYQNTVRDVLKVTTDYRQSLFKPAEVSGFSNNADVGTVSDSRLGFYLNVAQSIAAEVRPKLSTLVACSEDDKLVCANKIISTIAPALWRRPLTAAENAELIAFYSKSTVPSESMTLLLMRLLTSANFLYRSEVGSESGLTSYELASALSYFFWGTVPDKALLDLAADNTLSQDTVLVAQANRLLADKRSSYFLATFSSSWLGYKRLIDVEKSQTIFPNYNPTISGLMIAEANDTFEHIVRQGSSKFEDLLSNDYSIGGQQLAQYYKATTKKVGTVDTISFENESRRGFFSLGAIFASLAAPNQTNPFRIGGFLMSRLLCDEPRPTPDGLVVKLPEPKAGATSRELAEVHSATPACKGCHIKIDGIGFALENFDAVGVYRSTESGKPIDGSGKLVGVDGKDTAFTGADGLSSLLSTSRQAKRCFTIQLYRYAHGHLERSQDVCSIRDVANSFESEDLSLSQLIVKVITHDAFKKRAK